MIFYYKANGDLSFYTPSSIYQGSHKASDIYFVYPAGNGDIVTVAFNMPDGTKTDKLLMTKLNTTTIEDLLNSDGENYSVYNYQIPNNITNQTGYFKVQFYITTPSGITISTKSVSILVEHGVYTSTPQTTDAYEQVLQKLAQIENNKQDTLIFDETPTENSNNLVLSKGIKSYIDTAIQDKRYILIEKIIVGYTALIDQPSEGWYVGETLVEQDLNDTNFTPTIGTFYKHTGATNSTYPGMGIYYYNGTNYQSYYTNTGTAKNPTYAILTSAVTFESGKYFSYSTSGIKTLNRTTKLDGTSYNFRKLFFTANTNDNSKKIGNGNFYISNGWYAIAFYASANNILQCEMDINNGAATISAEIIQKDNGAHASYTKGYQRWDYTYSRTINQIFTYITYPSGTIMYPSGTTIEIYGIEA